MENVSTLVEGWDVTLPDGDKDTTGLRRLKGYTGENRVHRRLVIAEVGMPLSSFCSKKELVGTFLDVIKGEIYLGMQMVWA